MVGIPIRSLGLILATITLATCVVRVPAPAIPIFAHQYGVTCEKCHSVIPHLNAFGAAFVANGYRIPGVQPASAIPVAMKVNLADSSQNQGGGQGGAGLPKAIVDEVEVFTAGAIGSRASYLVEQYAVDGGMPGLLRDVWITDRINPWDARIPIYVQAGSFTLPLPVDPETFRDTYQGYAVYEQTVGANPFNFFDPKIGVRVSVGDMLQGPSLQLFAGPGHDRQSGLSSLGTDTMGYAQESLGPFTVSAYRYQGQRPVTTFFNDRFERSGYSLVYNQWARFSLETLLQTGWDSRCGLDVGGCSSSGGFAQLRYMLNRRLFVGGRYEGTADSTGTFSRDVVVLAGYGLSENSRLTAEDVIHHTPATMHTLNLQCTVSY